MLTRRILILLPLCLLAAIGGLLLVARALAPWPVFEPEYHINSLLSDSVITNMPRTKSSAPVFVAFDGRDPPADEFERIRAAVPNTSLLPISAAPPKVPTVNPDGSVNMGPLEPYEFVDVQFKTAPLYRTGIIGIKVRGCWKEEVAVLLSKRWHTISEKWLCT